MKVCILLVLLFSGFSAFAQKYECGKSEELNGKKKISIITGSDVESRARIIREIEKANLPLEIADSAAQADVFLVLRVGYVSGAPYEAQIESPDGTTFTSVESDKEAGVGNVFIVDPSSRRLRRVIGFRDVQRMPLERRPATNFAREFIKAYKTANGLK